MSCVQVRPASSERNTPVFSSPEMNVHGLRSELPHGGVEDVRIVDVDIHVGAAVVGVDVQHLLPGFAAVGGHEHAALIVGPGVVAQRADVGDIACSAD